MKRVLVISPHPDDETLGCGGTLRRHVLDGDEVHVAFLTSGEKGGHGRGEEETRLLREAEAQAAAEVLGLTRIEFWREPDGALAVTEPLVERLARLLRSLPADLVYVPHALESHPDHRAACRLTRAALARLDAEAPGPVALTYEVWTPTPRIAHVEDVSRHLEAKVRAIRAYRSQCEALAFDEAFVALARYRGEMHCWPGGDYAEVFGKLKWRRQRPRSRPRP